MKNKTLLSLIILSLIGSLDIAAKGKIEFDEIKDSIWTLTQNASQSRLRGDGQVLYFMSGDAFHTFTALHPWCCIVRSAQTSARRRLMRSPLYIKLMP